MTFCALIAVVLTLMGLSSTAQAQPRPTAPPATPPTLEILSPLPNQTYKTNVGLRAKLHNPPEKRLKVRISCFGVTHHLLLTPKPLAQRRGPADQYLEFTDQYLPTTAGAATLSIRIWPLDEPAASLVDREISFTVEKPTPADSMFENMARTAHAPLLLELERRYRFLAAQARTDPLAQERLPAAADALWSERIADFRNRLHALACLSIAHASALDPDRALACLERASAIYASEQGALNEHPLKGPMDWRGNKEAYSDSFMSLLVLVYGRSGHLDEAVQWLQEQAKDSRARWSATPESNTKGSAGASVARFYREIAFLYLLLKDDMASYEKWMQQSEAVQAEIRRMPP